MIGYEIDFAFCARPGFPPTAMLTAFRKTADEVIELLDYVGREHLYHIQLTEIEEITKGIHHEHRPQTNTRSRPSGR